MFPVTLLRADLVANRFIEDTYLLKPNNSLDKSVQIAVTRLGFYQDSNENRGTPVILMHGSFSNRSFWFSPRGKGFAKSLLEAGFDPWMVEARGHGDSPENKEYLANNIELYAQYDAPAIQEFVYEQTQKKAFWVGHSLGGVTVATAVAGDYIDTSRISGVVLFGSQVSRFPMLLRVPLLRAAARTLLLLKKRISGKGIGPEQEPVGIAKEFVRWAGLFSGWRSGAGGSYWAGMESKNLPALAFGAQKDKGDPARSCLKLIKSFGETSEFYLLSKKNGYKQDYNHVDMIISKPAEEEVWPKAIEWMSFNH